MSWFKRKLQTPAGRLVVWSSIISFLLSLVMGPGPANAMADSVHDTVKAMKGTHRRLSLAEMKAIVGATVSPQPGSPDPWEEGDSNTAGYGAANMQNGNELVSIPIVGYHGRGLSVGLGLSWNLGAVPSSPGATSSYPCGLGVTHSYNLYASVNAGTGSVTISEADGRQRLFTYTAGSYVPPAGIHDVLIKNVDGSYTLTRKNQTQYHFSATYSDTKGLHLDTITDSNGNQISISYSSFTVSGTTLYQGTSVTDATGRVLTLGYDSNSRLSTITDPASREWDLSYNASGDLTEISTPRVLSGVHTAYNLGYNSSNQMTSFEDRRGHTWSLSYNSYKLYPHTIASVTDPYNHSHSYSFGNSNGNIVTDENSNQFGYQYSGDQLQTYSDSPAGLAEAVYSYTWDSSNNRLSRSDGNSNTWNYTWDSNGNELSEEAPAVGGTNPTTYWTYNSHNDCTSIETPLGYVTDLNYSSADDLTGVTDALSHSVTYTVNSDGQVTGIEDPNSHSESLSYDSSTGMVASVTDADSNVTSYTWNDLSLMTSRTDARSNQTNYSFDSDSNLTEITYPDSSTVTVSYDANDSKTSMTDSHGTWGWTLDEDNRLTGTSDPSSRTIGYTLDYGGRVTEMTRQDSSTVQYGYDGGNRVTSITDSAISATASTLSYDNASNPTGMTLSNGATVTKGFDALERLTSVVNKTRGGTTISSYSYDYDDDSDRTSVTESDGSVVDFGYDHLHRLTSEARTGTDPYDYSYTLDAAGNRSVWTDNTHSTEVDYTCDSANRLTAAGDYSYGYDADGNRTSVTVGGVETDYSFDYEDRLTAFGTSVSYSYVGAGTDRYSKTVSGTTTQFLYDNGSVDEEMQGSTVTADYGANAEKLSGTVSWMLQDGQPNTRQLLNSSQTVVASYISDAFGNSVGGSGSSVNPFIWNGGSGYYSDGESGLQKVGARYYDPAVGRWISQDTMLVAGSPDDSQAVNRYAYCEANPIGRRDPGGHLFGIDDLIILVAICAIALLAEGCSSGSDNDGPTYNPGAGQTQEPPTDYEPGHYPGADNGGSEGGVPTTGYPGGGYPGQAGAPPPPKQTGTNDPNGGATGTTTTEGD